MAWPKGVPRKGYVQQNKKPAETKQAQAVARPSSGH
jgi:hypothetical protein